MRSMIVQLIPKQRPKPIFGQTFFLIVAGILLTSVLFAFFILQLFIGNLRQEIGVLDKRFQENRLLEEETSQRLSQEKRKLELLKLALQERRAVLPFFALLEQTTHPDVFFSEFSGNPTTGIFTLRGAAKNFFVLEQQRLVWEARLEFQTTIRDIRLGKGGEGEFTVEFTTDPEFLLIHL